MSKHLLVVSALLLAGCGAQPTLVKAPVKAAPAEEQHSKSWESWEEIIPSWKSDGWLPSDKVLEREEHRLRLLPNRTAMEQKHLNKIVDEELNRMR